MGCRLVSFVVLSLVACAPPAEETPLAPVGDGLLLIEELYYSGAEPSGGTDHYYSDQFVELVNAGDGALDLSGVMLGEAYGAAGEINPGMAPDSFRDAFPDDVVLASVWRIPDGVELEPGQTLVIAHDGTNHRPFSTLDLSGADLETWVDSGGDDDSPTVDNLEMVHFEGGYDWLITVFGPSVVVLEADTPLGDEPGPYGPLKVAPASHVLDGIDTVMDRDSGAFKRLPDAVDVGFNWVSGPYVGKSLHRVRDGESWQDTNDSGADFERGPPDPGLSLGTDDITGDPWVELGTGVSSVVPLTDGADLEIVAGLQGGWHVDTTLRFGGFGPDGVVVVYDAVDAGTAESISYVTQATLSEASVLPDGDGWARVGDRVVLDITSAAEVIGTQVVLRVTAALGDSTWSDERTVTLVDEQP